MGTKIRVDQDSLDDFEDFDSNMESDNPKQKRYEKSRRRDIEDILEERRLRSQIMDAYDERYFA